MEASHRRLGDLEHNHLERAKRKLKSTISRYHVAVICYDRKGQLLGIKTNRPRYSKYHGSVHAEMAAMRAWGRRIRSMVLVRVNSRGDLRPIHPCCSCACKASDLGISIHLIQEAVR